MRGLIVFIPIRNYSNHAFMENFDWIMMRFVGASPNYNVIGQIKV